MAQEKNPTFKQYEEGESHQQPPFSTDSGASRATPVPVLPSTQPRTVPWVKLKSSPLFSSPWKILEQNSLSNPWAKFIYFLLKLRTFILDYRHFNSTFILLLKSIFFPRHKWGQGLHIFRLILDSLFININIQCRLMYNDVLPLSF